MPNDHDACVGPLDAGTHSSVLFDLPLTFEVPAGWANHADSPGEYVLYAPGGPQPTIDGGPRDWIAIEANVTSMPEGCPAVAGL